ncbi:MAG: peptide MFS transporter [Myxococcaceae bacterium]|nr:peptide MFS transporter [Myxococcaceae bacterium]
MTQLASTGSHPKALKWLFLTEMWERFSYYLMIGILYLYLVDSQKGGMGMTGGEASAVVGTYLAFVYLTPFIGGLIADRVLGCRKTVMIGGAIMALGHLLMAAPALVSNDIAKPVLYVALGCLVIGNGCFKPNISTLVGNLYEKGSPLRDAGYNIFYMGINVGAFACNFVAAVVRNKYGWHWAFASAGFGMAAGLVIFALSQHTFAHADPDPKTRTDVPRESLKPLWLRCLGPAAVAGVIGYLIGGSVTIGFLFACGPIVYFFIWIWRGLTQAEEKSRTLALLTIYAIVISFWMIFHQNATALSEWASSQTHRLVSPIVKPVVDLAPDFAEPAPPSYYTTAGAETPRPRPELFRVVSDDEYKELKNAKKLEVQFGVPTPVTQKMFDDVYARAGAERIDDHLKLVNAELFQSINPGWIIIITPLFVGFFALLQRRRREPSTAAKIGLGLAITGVSALVMAAAAHGTNGGADKASAWWLFGTYGVVTVGELCLSPMGLSLVNRMAPRHISAFMMGGWFLAISFGNKLSGVFGELYEKMSDKRVFFALNALAVFVAAGVLFAVLPWLKRQMGEGKAQAQVAPERDAAAAASQGA